MSNNWWQEERDKILRADGDHDKHLRFAAEQAYRRGKYDAYSTALQIATVILTTIAAILLWIYL